MLERVEIERVHSGENASVYQGNDGRKYLLKPVDRQYQGRKKPPKYYLLVQGKGEAKPSYVSGLFPTAQAGVLSGDFRDELGVKHMFTFEVRDAGASAAIYPGRAEAKGRKGSPEKVSAGADTVGGTKVGLGDGTVRGAYGRYGKT